MIRNVGIISKPSKEDILAVVPQLATWLQQRGLKVYCDSATAECCEPHGEALAREQLPAKVDLLIVLGGDGTLLAAARLLGNRDVPILPVNLGGLGFLTSVTLNELYPLLEQTLAGQHRVTERMMLQAELVRGGKTIASQRALNDAVITKPDLARIMDFDVLVNDQFVGRYRADGLIVSTPTGSTAYSLAAGGPIIYPLLKAFVITPICPHMLTNRPLVVPDDSRVEIDLATTEQPGHLTVDGQIGFQLQRRDRIIITKAPNMIRLVRPQQKTYFEVLRSKLRWGER
jgi:NAD+ kinase